MSSALKLALRQDGSNLSLEALAYIEALEDQISVTQVRRARQEASVARTASRVNNLTQFRREIRKRIKEEADKVGLTVDAFIGKRRFKYRWAVVYEALSLANRLGVSLSEVAREFQMNHKSVIHIRDNYGQTPRHKYMNVVRSDRRNGQGFDDVRDLQN